MEGDHRPAVDFSDPRLLYPVAAPVPISFSDRLIRLTCYHGRLRTPRKQRVRLGAHYRLPKATPSAVGDKPDDEKLLSIVCDLLDHMNPRRVQTLHRCPWLGDPPMAPVNEPLARDQEIRNIILELSNLMEAMSMDEMDESSDAGGDDMERFVMEAAEGRLAEKPFELPMWVYNKLHTYQREALQWFWSLHCEGVGGILGDDMGLGKTMQVSAFLAGLFCSSLIRRALIVCPKTILDQWEKELSGVGLKKIRRFTGANKNKRNSELEFVVKEGGVLLTTYDMVRHNYKLIRGESCNQAEDDEEEELWDYVVVDEGHVIKESKTERAKSLHAIPCTHRIVITGTPMQNNFREIWALFSFCCPDLFGNLEKFKTKYEKIIVRGTNKNATSEEKKTGSAVAEEFRLQIKPYFLRRLKGEVQFDAGPIEQTSLSNKHELVVWLKLTDFQRKLYYAFLKAGYVDSSKQGSVFSAISTLKQICAHPGSLNISKYPDPMPNNPDDLESGKFLEMLGELREMIDTNGTLEVGKIVSCKLSFIMSLLSILLKDHHKILIFSETLYMLDCIEAALVLKGYKFLRIDGSTSERTTLVQEFQQGAGAPICLLSTKVGGLGITLTEASRVILVNPSWNPSTDSQSVDRAYRYGQEKDVIVYRLMTSRTLEEKIYKLQVFKGALFQKATSEGKTKVYFDREEAEEVLSLPEQGFDVSLTEKQLEEEHYGQSIDVSLQTHIDILKTLRYCLRWDEQGPLSQYGTLEVDHVLCLCTRHTFLLSKIK